MTENQSVQFPEIGLRKWPFHVVASEATEDVWVGRPQLKKTIERLHRSAARIPNSQLVLMWASFGAGKTHALMYLRRLAEQRGDVAALYVSTPRGVRNFLDLYRAVAASAIESGLAHGTGRRLLLRDRPPENDVERALLQFASGDNDTAQLAASWLRGDAVGARDRSSLGVTGRLDNAGAAIEGLQRLVHALQAGNHKTMLLLDEAQYLADLGRRLDECVGGLHKLFDSTPSGLTLMLSFTTGSQGTLRSILGDTLHDRVSQTISLPALTEDEADEFVTGLIRSASVVPETAPRPFTDASIRAVVKSVVAHTPMLTPRSLIKAADQVLREALPDLEDGEISSIDSDMVDEVLNEV